MYKLNETQIKRQAQMEYCDKKRIPYWAGDGICPSCHKNVFDGYTLKYCQSDIISGCPYCHYSLVD